MDILIKNATIIDGTGKNRYQSDIRVENDLIKEIGHLNKTKSAEVIDATNLFAMPGVIDVLNHSDTHWTLFDEPSQESLLQQGITTVLGGSCGSSLAPIVGSESLALIQKWVDLSRINVNWKLLREFLAELEKHPIGVNFGTLVGHGTLLKNVIGEEMRETSQDEVERMKYLLDEALTQGAFGVSFGLAFNEQTPSTAHEISSLAEVAATHHTVAAFHMRDEGKNLLAAIAEVLDIARTTGASVEISHLKAIGRSAWEQFPNAVEMLRSAVKEGLEMNADLFPYTRTGSLLFALLPEWAKEGGKEHILERFRDPIERQKIIDGIRELTLHFDRITIASTLRKSGLIGKTLDEAAQIIGMPPEETMIELLLVNDLAMTIFGDTLQEEHIEELLKEPFTMISSDGIGKSSLNISVIQENNLIHPRSFGTVPRILGYYTREKGVLTFEKAVRKMTSTPAEKFGIENRGRIEKGYFADIVLFDPNQIQDRATFANPYQHPQGIEWVIINGNAIVQHGVYRGALEGRVLNKS